MRARARHHPLPPRGQLRWAYPLPECGASAAGQPAGFLPRGSEDSPPPPRPSARPPPFLPALPCSDHGEAIEVLALPLAGIDAFVTDERLGKSAGLLYALAWLQRTLREGGGALLA